MSKLVQIVVHVLKCILYELLPIHPFYALKQSKLFLSNLRVLSASSVKAILYLAATTWKIVRSWRWQTWALLLIWFVLLSVFVKIEFGSLYLMGTGFGLIYYNLGDTRRDGDMSAWSVFNTGFKTMLGTLSAEQMDREIRHRNVHPTNDDDDDNGDD